MNTAQTSGVSIVIPTWNGQNLLEQYLPGVMEAAAAFTATTGLPAEIIIADDSSTDGTSNWLAENFPQVRLVRNKTQQGFGLNSNRGIEAARFPLVYLLNNDVAVAPGVLEPLAEHFTGPDVFAVTGNVYDFGTGELSGAGQLGEFRRGFFRVHRRYFVSEAPEKPAEPFFTAFASGGSVMYDREKFLALGGFNKIFSPFGWEDVELSLRAWRRGFTVHYEPRSAVWHRFSSTIGEKFQPRHVRAIYERNRLLTHWIHLETSPQIASHLTFLLLKLLGDTLRLRWETWSALRQALALLGVVGGLRKELLASDRRSLQAALHSVSAQLLRPQVRELNSDNALVRPFKLAEDI